MKVNSEKRAVACKQEVQISSADVAKSFASNVLSTGKSKIPTLIPRVDNPYDYSNRQKWFITTIVTIAAAAAPMGAAMFYRKAWSRRRRCSVERANNSAQLLCPTSLKISRSQRPPQTSPSHCICFQWASFPCGGPLSPRSLGEGWSI